ncbi:hypothetical protein, partial [Enterobacter roggenkampii]|uniref:hypothetical protein n=1 Tax=Enterobacter roggenkampii TaxID=1812935 RepID=UPI0019547A61
FSCVQVRLGFKDVLYSLRLNVHALCLREAIWIRFFLVEMSANVGDKGATAHAAWCTFSMSGRRRR